MNALKRISLLPKVAVLVAVTGVGCLISLPVLAQLNPNPSIFNEPPYNRRFQSPPRGHRPRLRPAPGYSAQPGPHHRGAPGYDALAAPGYGRPPAPQPGYGPPRHHHGRSAAPQPGYGRPPAPQQGYGVPPAPRPGYAVPPAYNPPAPPTQLPPG